MADAQQLRLDSERAFRLAGGFGLTGRNSPNRKFSDELNDLGWNLYREAVRVQDETDKASDAI